MLVELVKKVGQRNSRRSVARWSQHVFLPVDTCTGTCMSAWVAGRPAVAAPACLIKFEKIFNEYYKFMFRVVIYIYI